MSSVFELGIVGMGPAGLGLVKYLQDTQLIKSTICFDRGELQNTIACAATTGRPCCGANYCSIISGIGGASNLSSGKISDYPAGSGLSHFFDSEYHLKEMMLSVITFLKKNIGLKKIFVPFDDILTAQMFYNQRNIRYKYYDVYEFDGNKYRQFIFEMIHDLKRNGLNLLEYTDVVNVCRDTETNLFKITAKTGNMIENYYTKKLVVATGALEVNDQLLTTILDEVNQSYEVGIRIESGTRQLKSIFQAHGDLKLKLNNERTYCTTKNGSVITYRTNNLHFLEGSMDFCHRKNVSNFAVLSKINNGQIVSDFLQKYKNQYLGIPIKQSYEDYINNLTSSHDVPSTLKLCQNGNINQLLPLSVNNSLKSFIDRVLINTLGINGKMLTLIAPELKILKELTLTSKFEATPDLFIIGAATGKFRGILQSICSGIKCGNYIVGR